MAGDPSWYDRPATLVEGLVDDMWGEAQESLDLAKSLMTELGTFDLPSIPSAPSFTPISEDIPEADVPTAPEVKSFGSVQPFLKPSFESVGLVDDTGSIEDPPAFNPSITSISIPNAPGDIDTSGMPQRPTIIGVDIPSAPALAIPSEPLLHTITIPAFTFPDLPIFDAAEPEFEETDISTVIEWDEPVYQSELLDELVAKVRWMLEGGTGIPSVVEQALFDKARSREDMTAGKLVQEAFSTWAGRGFDMPPGMLAKQVSAAIENNHLAVNDLSRDILAKSAVWEIENLRFAVQQGLALEQLLVNIFNNMAQRLFEAAKYRVESQLAVYNAKVSLFNARQAGYQAAAQVYEVRLKGELSRLEVFKAEIDGQRAIGEINDQAVKLYSARMSAVESQVGIYKAQMEGARVQAEVASSQIAAFRADIEAYASKLNASKVRFDAYESQIRGESAKIGILEAESRAYAATVQAFESKNNIKTSRIRAQVDAIQAGVSKYTAEIQAERDRVNSEVEVIRANTGAYTADVGRYTAEIQAASSEQEMHARAIEARLRNNIAMFEVQLKQYDALVQRIIEEARLKNEAAKSAAQVASQIASGAMSGMHISASLSGSGSLSGSDSLSISHSHQYQEK